ncbi:MAG: insulinase family protein, partial [Bdellovibrionaceae bacterium]|nr:insulinase family protein [Pseudobdellovibrionaceae bacterium]
KEILKSENLVITAVGDFDKKKLVEKLNQIVSMIPVGKRIAQKFNVKSLNKEVLSYTELKKEQSHIVVGYRGLPLGDKDRYALDVIQSILSGQGGRLFIELRDKNSLAYSVSPIRMEGIETGYFGGYIGCSPEKVDKSIEMLKTEFKKLTEIYVADEELLRAQRYLAGRNDIELQKKSSICNGILFDVVYGMEADEIFKASEKYFKVTKEDVKKVSQRIFNSPAVISIVGAQAPKI